MNNKKTGTLWSRGYAVACVALALMVLTFFLMLSFITEYTIKVYSVGQSQAWLAASLFIFACLPARLFIGRYMDIWGRKRTLVLSTLVYLAVMLINLLELEWHVYLIFRFVLGLAFGASSTVLPTIAIDLVSDDRKAEGSSYVTLGNLVASSIGPYVGSMLWDMSDNPKILFAGCAVFVVITFILCLTLKAAPAVMNEEQKAVFRQHKLSNFYEKSVLPLTCVLLMMGIGYSSVTTYVNSFSLEMGYTVVTRYYFLVYALFAIAVRPFAGVLMDRKNENHVLYPVFACFIVNFISLALAQKEICFFVSAALLGIGYGTSTCILQATFVKIAPKHHSSLAMSTYYFALDLGIAIGPLIVGILVNAINFHGVYWIMCGVLMLAVIFYYMVHGRKVHMLSKK